MWDRHRHLPPFVDQGGKLVVVTGGGRGIGEKAVRKLVMREYDERSIKFYNTGGLRVSGDRWCSQP